MVVDSNLHNMNILFHAIKAKSNPLQSPCYTYVVQTKVVQTNSRMRTSSALEGMVGPHRCLHVLPICLPMWPMGVAGSRPRDSAVFHVRRWEAR